MIRTVLSLALLLAVITPAVGQPKPLPVDDPSLIRQMPGAGVDYKMPERVFEPAFVKLLRDGDPVYRKFLYRSVPRDADKWIAVPLDRWEVLIGDFAPVSVLGGHPTGLSPFTGKLFAGLEVSDEQFVNSPFQAKEKGTDYVVYAREEDMPADYRWKPNHTEKIPHMDGTVREYRFYVPPKFKNAGPEANSGRVNWFCPAGELQRVRVNIVMRRVIPDLVAAIVLEDNDKAVTPLAAVLDRIATVYPGMPLYCGAKAHGLARSPDHKTYMTAEQYHSVVGKKSFIDVRDRADYPFWYVDIYDFSFDKFHGGVSAWTDGVMDQMGWIAAAFDLIRDRPETRAYSQEKYGDAGAWEKRFRERCLKELEGLALATPPTTGNTSYAYITGSAKAGIACGNKALFEKSLQIIEMYLYNNWFPDGMAGDAAYNYAMMTQGGILGLSWMNRLFGGVDLADTYPLKATIDRLGIAPITTLYGIPSKHADQHSYIFVNGGDGPDPKQLDYADHEGSQSLPFYGLTALRGGVPGRRVELIVNHQNAFQHAHRDRLSYQLFYEGVDCLPDFGYCIGFIDPARRPWSQVRTDYELMGLPNTDTDRWGPWKWGYADMPEAHNILMVDQWFYKTVPCQMRGYAGAASSDEPGWWAQFVDTDAASLFVGRPNPVDIYRRQLAVLTLPGGAPVVMDVFRVRGGARHDLFRHVPADRPAMPNAGTPQRAEHWGEYQGLTNYNYDVLTRKSIRFYGRAGRMITDIVRHELPQEPWRTEWHIKPQSTFVRPQMYRPDMGNWPELLHEVKLGLWTAVSGSAAEAEMVCARGPWPGFLEVKDPDQGRTVRATVGLKGALDYRILTRKSKQPGLETTVVQASEARTPDQAAQLTGFAVEKQLPLAEGGGAVVRLDLADGTRGYFGSTLGGKTVECPSLSLTGRMGAVFPKAHRLALVDGTSVASGGWALTLEPGWTMTLAGLVGDLTGKPGESALIVTSDRGLPTDGTLTGRFVYIDHRAGEHLQSVYTVSKVTDLGAARWRIDLEGTPPFIKQRARILKMDPNDPHKLEQAFQFHVVRGELNVTGHRIRFPRSGFETAMVEAGRSAFTVRDAPAAGQVTKDDPFVVFAIQAGDRVTIPSRFACTGEVEDGGALRLSVQTTGKATLTVPGGFTKAEIETPRGKRAVATRPVKGGLAVELTPAALPGGRGVVVLRP